LLLLEDNRRAGERKDKADVLEAGATTGAGVAPKFNFEESDSNVLVSFCESGSSIFSAASSPPGSTSCVPSSLILLEGKRRVGERKEK
jgi:hypothetical protein